MKKRKGSLKDKFGIDGLLRTMRDNENDPSVQERACWAIGTLAQDRSIEIHQQLTSRKAPDLISKAIIKFGKDNIDLSNYALQACHHLSKIKQNRIFIIRSGLLDSVISAMKWHLKNEGIQSLGCLVLERLSNKEQYQTILGRRVGLKSYLWL